MHFPIPDFLDPYVKRLGITLACTTALIYGTSIVSKKIYKLARRINDEPIVAYEWIYYFLITTFIILTSIIIMGGIFPFVDTIGADTNVDLETFTWQSYPELIKFIILLWAINFIWKITILGCLISRYIEWSYKIKIDQ